MTQNQGQIGMSVELERLPNECSADKNLGYR